MKYREIPPLEKPISLIAQGTMMLKKEMAEDGYAILDAAFEAGVNFYDAAHIYGGGDCERVFGEWVRNQGIREQIVLLDKCCHHSKDRKRVTPFDITADLYDCLARLKFDYIDLFLFHRDDASMPVEPLVERMNKHISEGLIRAFGASNWSAERVQEANRFAKENGMAGFALSSAQYSLAECLEDPWGGNSVTITGHGNQRARQWYVQTQIPLVAWSSLCGGFFSGRFSRDNLETFTDPADLRCIRCYCSKENFARLDRAGNLADQRGATPAQIALAYLLNGPVNCFPLMAAWTPEQARENAAAAEVILTEAEAGYLNLERDKP